MRILYLTVTLPFSAGGEDFFVPGIEALRRLGHEILIVPRSPKGALQGVEASELLKMTRSESLISWMVLSRAAGEWWRNAKTVTRMASKMGLQGSIMNRMKNLLVFPKGLWVAGIARDWRADHIHAQWATTTATMALIASEVTGIPWSFTAHRGDIVQNNLLKLKVEQASFVRFISRSGVLLAKSLGISGVETKARVIHMGVRLPRMAEDHQGDKCPAVAICPANLIPVKGHTYLLQAVGLLKEKGLDITLKLAGKGPIRPRLEKEVRALGIEDRVTFLGQIPHDEVLRMLQTGGIGMMVLPSVDLGGGHHEGIPVSLMEAMSHGVPVISTSTGGVPEILRDGAGLIVPPQDAKALAEAMESVLIDNSLRQSLQAKGRRRVEEEFSADRSMVQLSEAFEHSRGKGTGA